ncbi:lasso peptide biosynthesis PqqD family chaperone [Goodfellowiella coeruleoviolacea]|uniref:Coenzyme PQQ synthesis protein D (PqqD) n=1 Tax=Goodfellowiella coeruleoviolacea TaxID=334858 RepID=A0AAE3KJW4_9PSEU|nr:lasso peptide biosynthesis PqqD family chaperone [Goodfellowiella coeruleoviolacea]MCP2170075.1 Coenzyme PQQ synthesis protein D (PqqD) [Goodfellowiella coeruleoviolacea]
MISLAEHVKVIDTGDGAVLLDERASRYWQINGTGAAILDRLLAGDDPESAADALRQRFPDAGERIGTDIRNLLDALRAAKLVTP